MGERVESAPSPRRLRAAGAVTPGSSVSAPRGISRQQAGVREDHAATSQLQAEPQVAESRPKELDALVRFHEPLPQTGPRQAVGHWLKAWVDVAFRELGAEDETGLKGPASSAIRT